MSSKQQPKSIAEAMAAKKSAPRKVEYFPVPVDLQNWDDGRKVVGVGLFKLSIDEELTAMGMGAGDSDRSALECIQASMAELELAGGKIETLSKADGTAQAALEDMPAPLRGLVGIGYTAIHAPTPSQQEGFLAGRRVVVR